MAVPWRRHLRPFLRGTIADPRLALAAQVVRFGLSGGLVATLGFLSYAIPAIGFGAEPLLSYLFSHCVAVAAGYTLHSRLSFANHGARGRSRTLRFLAVSLVSLSLNSLFVWVLTGPLGGPPWWPLLPMAVVTPAIAFLLNRQWVFGRR